MLDTGIDYTHEAFGGFSNSLDAQYGAETTDPENKDMHQLCNLRTTRTSSAASTSSVRRGRMTVTAAAMRPDPDPIDCGGKTIGPEAPDAPLCDGGHGTHVADIIGGIDGVAPGVELYGVKVCSAVVNPCSGVALLPAMDFALDPNGDGNTNDHVDIVNMSLGAITASGSTMTSPRRSRTPPRWGPDSRGFGRQCLRQAVRSARRRPRRARCPLRRPRCRPPSSALLEVIEPAELAGPTRRLTRLGRLDLTRSSLPN